MEWGLNTFKGRNCFTKKLLQKVANAVKLFVLTVAGINSHEHWKI